MKSEFYLDAGVTAYGYKMTTTVEVFTGTDPSAMSEEVTTVVFNTATQINIITVRRKIQFLLSDDY